MRILKSRVLALSLLLLSAPVFAGIADQLNAIRSRGCTGGAGVQSPLRTNRDLNAVAREWSKGGRLSAAFERVGYRATRSFSIRVAGADNEKAFAQLMKKRYCETLTEAAFKEVGIFQRSNTAWIVFAMPFVTLTTKDADEVREEVLALVNEARSRPRQCGRASFDVAPPLKLSAMLNHAALVHSQDMARKNFFEHEGSDGSRAGDRIARVGYRWRSFGENIAAGAENAQVVVRGWLDSPGHCSNIMGARYTEMGVAYATNPKSDAIIYWTQVFATPR